jgi:hypothetical protein
VFQVISCQASTTSPSAPPGMDGAGWGCPVPLIQGFFPAGPPQQVVLTQGLNNETLRCASLGACIPRAVLSYAQVSAPAVVLSCRARPPRAREPRDRENDAGEGLADLVRARGRAQIRRVRAAIPTQAERRG